MNTRPHRDDTGTTHVVRSYRSRGRVATLLQALLFGGGATLVGLWGFTLRTASLQVVLPFFVIDQWLSDLPLLGGLLALTLGEDSTLVDLMALGLAAGSIGLYAVTAWSAWELVTRPDPTLRRPRIARLVTAIALCAVLVAGDLRLGTLEATTIDLLQQADALVDEETALDLPLSSIPTLEQIEGGEAWVMVDAEGEEIALDHGSLATAARWGGRIFLLAHGVVPALALALGLSLAAVRLRELPRQV